MSRIWKIFLFFIPFLALIVIFLFIVLVINRDDGKGAVQVTSVPQSQVYINGKFVGKTPLCLCELPQFLKVGDYQLKLVPVESGFKPWETSITIYRGVMTVVDRTFDKMVSLSSGSLITLSDIEDEDKSEILIISLPSKAQVILDSNPAGVTPLLLKEVTASDHEIKILKDGYKEKILKIKTIPRKKLEATVSLGVKPDLATQEPKSTSSASIQKIVVLDTPNGFLRVRQSDSVDSAQIAILNTNDQVDLVSEKEEWFEIRLEDGRTGWISSSYARKL